MSEAFILPSDLILLVRYLLVKSDVEGAMYVLNTIADTDPDKYEVLQYICKYWPQAFNKKLYEETVCKDPYEVAAVEVNVKNEPRWPMVIKALSDILDSPKSVLDFGCSRGLWARALKKEFVNIETYLGIDTARDSIDYANDSVVKDNLTNMWFGTGDHTALPKKEFDCVICMEVLEHVFNFLEVLNALEDSCKHNGWMLITTPIGAYEVANWLKHPFAQRPHIRELRTEDWKHLMNQKAEAFIGATITCEDLTGDPGGTHIVCWKVTDDNRGFNPDYLHSRLQLKPKEIGLIW